MVEYSTHMRKLPFFFLTTTIGNCEYLIELIIIRCSILSSSTAIVLHHDCGNVRIFQNTGSASDFNFSEKSHKVECSTSWMSWSREYQTDSARVGLHYTHRAFRYPLSLMLQLNRHINEIFALDAPVALVRNVFDNSDFLKLISGP